MLYDAGCYMATRKIAVLTSGGDAPGMNAAIRAVARTGHLTRAGRSSASATATPAWSTALIEPLGARDVGGILQRGGTFLGSARCASSSDEAVRARGARQLRRPRHRRRWW